MPYVTFKIGTAGNESNMTFQIQSLNITPLDILAEVKNIQGDYKKNIFKVNVPDFAIGGIKLTQTDYNLFVSMKSRRSLLNFIFRDDLAVVDEEDTSSTTLLVTLMNTAASGIVPTGVWLKSDPTHAATNYYTGGGTYNSTTRVLTLHSALPGANTDVLINYTYTGFACIIKSISIAAMQGQSKLFYTANMMIGGA